MKKRVTEERIGIMKLLPLKCTKDVEKIKCSRLIILLDRLSIPMYNSRKCSRLIISSVEVPAVKKPVSLFTKVEMEFMQIVWDQGELSPEDIRAALREKGRTISNGGTRRILSILCEKGHIARKKDGRRYLYRACINKKQAFNNILVDLRKRVFGDSGVMMMAAFFDSFQVDDSELKEIKRLIEKQEREHDE